MSQSVCRWGLLCFLTGSLLWLGGCADSNEEPEVASKTASHEAVQQTKVEQQSPFTWKFDKNKTYHWITTTSVVLTAPQGDKEVTGKGSTTLDFDIQVLEQDPTNGNSLLKFNVVRIRSKSTLPEMEFDYDSAKKVDESDSEKSFATEMITSIAAALLQVEVECRVDPQGVIQVVKYDQELKQQIQSMPGSESTAALLEAKGLNSIFFGGIIPFPKSVIKIDDQWSQSLTYPARGLGDMTLTFFPQYKGEVKIKEKELEQFDISIDVSLKGLLPPTMVKLGKQTSSGAFYFDPQANIVRQCEWKVSTEMLLNEGKAKGQIEYEGRSRFGLQSDFKEND